MEWIGKGVDRKMMGRGWRQRQLQGSQQSQNQNWRANAARQAPYQENQGENVAVNWWGQGANAANQFEEEEDSDYQVTEEPEEVPLIESMFGTSLDNIPPEVVRRFFDPDIYLDATDVRISREAYVGINAVLDGRIRERRLLSNADRLRMALTIDGGVNSPSLVDVPNQAHHIVETSNEDGQQILREVGIESDSAVNGVLLPTTERDDTGEATPHFGSHSRDYRDSVNRALRAALRGLEYAPSEVRQQAVVTRLRQIRTVLLTKMVPLNARVQARRSERTGRTITVEKIFEEAGLFGPVQ